MREKDLASFLSKAETTLTIPPELKRRISEELGLDQSGLDEATRNRIVDSISETTVKPAII